MKKNSTFTGLELSELQFNKLENLAHIFWEWNQKMNLSALRDLESIRLKHLADSLLFWPELSPLIQEKNLDLGTGGGFPLLPLAIMSEKAWWGIDATQKKLTAVQAMADELELKIQTKSGRFEELAHQSAWRSQFDFISARAVAPWPQLLELALGFLKKDGVFAAWQGPSFLQDQQDYPQYVKHFGGEIIQVYQKKLAADADRYLVLIQKQKDTPSQYPRAYSQIRTKVLREFGRKN
ncbi:MAG TPA: 16S rRNA (guanine(527)-N(7))-methyltransferase RsmG [Candidatus Gracilibacteria bacterium]|nr:16S rRNA (guanine(527)-N(7))-methyltransferase RsmG [Candidatus Gracilibacteria bacterium]